MIKYFLILVLLSKIVESIIDDSSYDDDVMNFILQNKSYNKLVRPSKKVNVSFTLSYRQLVSLEEKTQIMTSNVYIFANWYDSRLTWDPESLGNLTDIVMSATMLWVPDFAIINTASTNVFITINDSNLAQISSDGYVSLVLSIPTLQTRCKVNVYRFPFDKQNCSIVIGSWQLDKSRIDFSSDESKINLSDYIPSGVWSLDKIEVNNASSLARVTDSDDIAYYVIISRRPLYYMTTFIPCYILNVATLLAFFVGNAIVVQVNLCMTTFLTFGVYSLKIAGDITTQSEYFPLASVYFIVAIIYTLLALTWFICANYYLTRNRLPRWMAFIAKYVKIALFCIFPKEKIESKLKEKDVEREGNYKINDSVSLNSNLRNRTVIVYEKPLDLGCNKCNMCKNCETNKSKEDIKKKEREILESNVFALNILVFIFLFVIMLSTNLGIWIAASK